jgi:quercetin dioxygenase-like cupin family protein
MIASRRPDVDEETRVVERIISGQCRPQEGSPGGVTLRTFVSEMCGATGFSTGTATFQDGAELAYHTHLCSEAITILKGHGSVLVEGRAYHLSPLDSIHIPAHVAHSVRNAQAGSEMVAHWAFGSSQPSRSFVEPSFPFEDRGFGAPSPGDPETINRLANCQVYELAEGALFCDLFARRFGSKGICGGYGRFAQGSSLPCHVHEYDESITIVGGEALCLVQGRQYKLSGFDTAFVPKRRPHRFFNGSETMMEMLWVYAGDEPDRRVVDPGYCAGSSVWPFDAPKGQENGL